MTQFVLVHGAFEGGWCWQRVAKILRNEGHEVFTPTLTGCGDRAHLLSRDITLEMHVLDIAGLLEMEGLDEVVMVGHSYGGTVATVASDRCASQVSRLIYLDASAPGNGQASTGAFAEGTEDKLTEMASGTDWQLPPLPLDAVGITDPADIAWVEPRRRPHPIRTLHEAVVLQRGDEPAPFPVSYISHSDHEAMVSLFGVDPLAPFVDKAKAQGWSLRTLEAGHDAMITHPQEVATVLLEEAAR
ncbi:MAG: alpha/beta fold hydrolase [Nannocystales bacterium]